VAEGAPLLREYTLTGIEGSNPSLTAKRYPVRGVAEKKRVYSTGRWNIFPEQYAFGMHPRRFFFR
jgi:hypothetical protein